MTRQCQKWTESHDFQGLMRQVHVDIYVALKNGVPQTEVKLALLELAAEIVQSVAWDTVNPKISK